MSERAPGEPVGDGDYIAIQRFLYREAALLDRRAFGEWLGLVTEDIVYRVTAQVVREAAAGNQDYAIIDEDAASLRMRVEQIGNPRLTRAENPATLARHFVSNVEARHGSRAGEFEVEANLLVYRNRAGVPEGGFYAGARSDVLRRIGGELRLARRLVRLDHAVIYGGPVSILF